MQNRNMKRATAQIALGVSYGLGCLCLAGLALAQPKQKVEDFGQDPGWEELNNRPDPNKIKTTVQDFGYQATSHLNPGGGEIGGAISRSITPATYAKIIPIRTLNDRLEASGRFAVMEAKGGSGMLCGWFNSASRGWRTPNSLAFRIDGNGGKCWIFYEYGTRDWQTGGGVTFAGERYQTTKTPPMPADGKTPCLDTALRSRGRRGKRGNHLHPGWPIIQNGTGSRP